MAEESTPGQEAKAPAARRPGKILVVDIGGTNVKVLASGQTDKRKAPSGRQLTPARLVEVVRELAKDWEYEAISLGFPGPVGPEGPRVDPLNLAPGWIGYDFAAAFGVPVKVVNDAVMQALGGYQGGRMLYFGVGTGIGSALIAGRSVFPLELGELRYARRRTLADLLGRGGLRRLGRRRWRRVLAEAVTFLHKAFLVDYVLIGGGNAKEVGIPPPGSRMGSNRLAFRGGYRLWGLEMTPTQTPDGGVEEPPPADEEWRMV